MKLNKIGSHVGVIISFAIFIIFLVFLFIILEPSLKVTEKKEATIENIEALLVEYLDSELTTASVKINVALTENCITFNQLEPITATGLTGSNIFVKNSTNSNMEFKWTEPNLMVKNEKKDNFFKVYASSAINSPQTYSPTGCQSISQGKYTMGIVKTEEKTFEKNIIDAIEDYKADYSAFKQETGISDEVGFDFAYENGTIIKQEKALKIKRYMQKKFQ